MAWFDVLTEEQRVVLDVHGYTVDTAVIAIEGKLSEAWEAGYAELKVIHGAPDIQTQEQVGGRGSIKHGILYFLEMLDAGQDLIGWAAWVDSYEREDGTTLIYLMSNPTPNPEHWSELPEAEFPS